MGKFLYITTENKYVYRVPAEVVADNRAKYYAEKDSDTTYQEEYDYTLSDDYELLDWFSGNMNWEDVGDKFELIEQPEKDIPVLGQDEVEIRETK
jgi:hypothetical protein